MFVALADAYPVSPGHVLIVPRRHEPDFFRLTDEERAAMWEMVPAVRRTIERNHAPAGYNIGINVGAAAGQTVPHAHLHVIPRYAGDSADPRGGVRWVLPERARYWQ
ncbi:MAG: HIT family protein [Deltaproteobacteria bacterium]|nr:HIT family protein [Deltaproteobacteria bacterium]